MNTSRNSSSQELTEYRYAGDPQTLRAYQPQPTQPAPRPAQSQAIAQPKAEEKGFLAAVGRWFSQPRNLGIISFIAGMASIAMAFLPIGALGALPGALGVFVANRAKRLGGDGYATAGIVMSIIGLCLACLSTILLATCGSAALMLLAAA